MLGALLSLPLRALTTLQSGKDYCTHFTDEKTKVHSGEMSCPGSPAQVALTPRTLGPQSQALPEAGGDPQPPRPHLIRQVLLHPASVPGQIEPLAEHGWGLC